MEQISLVSLWLPILASAAVVFVAAAIAWTVLPHHRSDWVPVPKEDSLIEAIRGLELERGQYVFPHQMGHEGAKAEEAKQKLREGPRGSLIIWDMPDMRRSLVFYFTFSKETNFCKNIINISKKPTKQVDIMNTMFD